jgi:hypothetical protein
MNITHYNHEEPGESFDSISVRLNGMIDVISGFLGKPFNGNNPAVSQQTDISTEHTPYRNNSDKQNLLSRISAARETAARLRKDARTLRDASQEIRRIAKGGS